MGCTSMVWRSEEPLSACTKAGSLTAQLLKAADTRTLGHWLMRTLQVLQQSKASNNKNTVVWWIFGSFPEFLRSHNHLLSSTNSLRVHHSAWESELTVICLGRNPFQSLPSHTDDQLKQLLLKKKSLSYPHSIKATWRSQVWKIGVTAWMVLLEKKKFNVVTQPFTKEKPTHMWLKTHFSLSTPSFHPQEQETWQTYRTKTRWAKKSCSIGFAPALCLWFCWTLHLSLTAIDFSLGPQ